ncbi:hypothetical protein J7T55_010603 [Diaporthe amygdali]|uniref:uncharacterized protein n=1 Tax=Phomopsis amygdali TaxID=1214568 RepID=UPI0022FE1457|nr:uncharacterized protein J7T55_010603 [Diaporthe amygdali]KAJ0115780.1 hypothetical protein J7T55_010603 [Diaporthe amygdali]
MPPRKVKSDPAVEGQDSPGLSAIQPWSGNTADTVASDNNTDTNVGAPTVSPSHPLPVIHETGGSYINSQFPSLEEAGHGLDPNQLFCTDNTGIPNIPSAPSNPSLFIPLSLTGNIPMNTMPRNSMPSGNASNQGGTGNGTGNKFNRQSRQATRGVNPNTSRAAPSPAANPGQNQRPGFQVDLTRLDDTASSSDMTGLFDSTLNSSLDPSLFMMGGYNTSLGVSGGMQQNAQQRLGYNTMSPVPKFDPDHSAFPPFPTKYESFMQEEEETKPDLRSIATEDTPRTPVRKRPRTSVGSTGTAPAAITSSPAVNTSSPAASSLAGGGDQQAPAASHTAHVPPNRILEAGPLRHPDPEWRPYGVNHWHVFLTEPTTLKYLSSTEIKDIREHCYELAKAAGVGDAPQPITNTAYTTADAQAVWRHCDAYVRRRGQVRNNQAARRSRARKDAETRYWKAKALEYGAPDHEFIWDGDEGSPGSPSAPAAATVPQPQAQGRVQGQGQGGQGGSRSQGQAQSGQGQPQTGRSGGRQGQDAARGGESAATAAQPEFDFNQPMGFGRDSKTHGTGHDAFMGGF